MRMWFLNRVIKLLLTFMIPTADMQFMINSPVKAPPYMVHPDGRIDFYGELSSNGNDKSKFSFSNILHKYTQSH